MFAKVLYLSILMMASTVAAVSAKDLRDLAVDEVRSHFEPCQEAVSDRDNWTGWRRDYGNGHRVSFQFYDRGYDAQPSVLRVIEKFADGVEETTTSCFREPGNLAHLSIVTKARDLAPGSGGEIIQRIGEIYYDFEDRLVRNIGWIADEDGVKLGPIDSWNYQLARGCNAVSIYRTLEDVDKAITAVMGDSEGFYPAFKPEQYFWCAAAREPEASVQPNLFR